MNLINIRFKLELFSCVWNEKINAQNRQSTWNHNFYNEHNQFKLESSKESSVGKYFQCVIFFEGLLTHAWWFGIKLIINDRNTDQILANNSEKSWKLWINQDENKIYFTFSEVFIEYFVSYFDLPCLFRYWIKVPLLLVDFVAVGFLCYSAPVYLPLILSWWKLPSRYFWPFWRQILHWSWKRLRLISKRRWTRPRTRCEEWSWNRLLKSIEDDLLLLAWK